jgi:hypothetical protein
MDLYLTVSMCKQNKSMFQRGYDKHDMDVYMKIDRPRAAETVPPSVELEAEEM